MKHIRVLIVNNSNRSYRLETTIPILPHIGCYLEFREQYKHSQLTRVGATIFKVVNIVITPDQDTDARIFVNAASDNDRADID